ncbi:unnamed protein product, partial [Rotaria sp. Silwood2]
MEGENIAIFGLTSTGKSTLLNSLMGEKLAETGREETATRIQPYQGVQFTVWDVPGRNDEVIYISMQFISFFKGLTRRLIVIGFRVKDNSSTMKLLDEIGLDYDIVVNKFDIVDVDEREKFREQILGEIQALGLQR